MFTGIVMVVMASPVVKRSTVPLRLLNGVLGAVFFGYGFYLTFLFHGGSYFIVFKAFLLPAVLVFRTIQRAIAGRRTVAPPVPPHVAAGTPAPYPTFDRPQA